MCLDGCNSNFYQKIKQGIFQRAHVGCEIFYHYEESWRGRGMPLDGESCGLGNLVGNIFRFKEMVLVVEMRVQLDDKFRGVRDKARETKSVRVGGSWFASGNP